jgi:DNA-binding IclR family transcriptional regulator
MTIAAGIPCSQSATPRTLRESERLLLDHLVSRSHSAGPVEATVADLAAAIGMSRRTVQRASQALARSGRITVEPPSWRWGSKRYRVASP